MCYIVELMKYETLMNKFLLITNLLFFLLLCFSVKEAITHSEEMYRINIQTMKHAYNLGCTESGGDMCDELANNLIEGL